MSQTTYSYADIKDSFSEYGISESVFDTVYTGVNEDGTYSSSSEIDYHDAGFTFNEYINENELVEFYSLTSSKLNPPTIFYPECDTTVDQCELDDATTEPSVCSTKPLTEFEEQLVYDLHYSLCVYMRDDLNGYDEKYNLCPTPSQVSNLAKISPPSKPTIVDPELSSVADYGASVLHCDKIDNLNPEIGTHIIQYDDGDLDRYYDDLENLRNLIMISKASDMASNLKQLEEFEYAFRDGAMPAIMYTCAT